MHVVSKRSGTAPALLACTLSFYVNRDEQGALNFDELA